MMVLLVQVDGKMPNLAIMKLSAWHKRNGDEVFFKHVCDPDIVYVSCVYTWNRSEALGIAKMFPDSQVILGGSGVNYEPLPDDVEHIMPDYDLYNIDYSMGFTSRGCFRECTWCIVPKKEGYIREHASISEFLHPNHSKLFLFDNNFLASPKWREKLTEIIDRDLKVTFNQGLDVRLLNEENANLLSKIKYYDSDFSEKRLYFAFDIPQLKKVIIKGVNILNDVGVPSRHLMFYMLCGFNTSHGEDMERFNILNDLGVDPFVMKYNNRKDDLWLNHFTRWINRRRYKACDWKDYDHGNSQKIILNEG